MIEGFCLLKTCNTVTKYCKHKTLHGLPHMHNSPDSITKMHNKNINMIHHEFKFKVSTLIKSPALTRAVRDENTSSICEVCALHNRSNLKSQSNLTAPVTFPALLCFYPPEPRKNIAQDLLCLWD